MGPGPAATANLVILADAAFSFILGLISKGHKLGGLCPDLGEPGRFDLTTIKFKKSTRLDLTGVGDKTKPGSAQTAPGHGVQSEVIHIDLDPFFPGPLTHDPVIMGGTGGLEMHGCGLAEIIEPIEDFLVFFRVDYLISDFVAPARGHEEKDMPGSGPDVFGQMKDLLEEGHIVFGNRGVDLKFHTSLLELFDPCKRGIKGPWNPAEIVVGCGIRAVNGNAAPLNPGFLDLGSHGRIDTCPIGAHDTAESLGFGIGDELKDVLAHQGLSPGENDDRVAGFRKGVDQGLGLVGSKLAGIGLFMGLGPTMLAGKIAGSGDLPGNEAQGRGFGVMGGVV